MNDYRSSFLSAKFGSKSPEKVPAVGLKQVVEYLNGITSKDIFGFEDKNELL